MKILKISAFSVGLNIRSSKLISKGKINNEIMIAYDNIFLSIKSTIYLYL